MSDEHEALVCDRLYKKFMEKGKNFPFKSSLIAKELDTNSYVVRDALKKLEKKKLVERTDLSRTVTIWRTHFNKNGVC